MQKYGKGDGTECHLKILKFLEYTCFLVKKEKCYQVLSIWDIRSIINKSKNKLEEIAYSQLPPRIIVLSWTSEFLRKVFSQLGYNN